jgi:ubiquinone/menaquinone biosynthesis C-methylase UbiE
MRRVEEATERMDAPDAEEDELHRALRDLRRVNGWLGGTRSVLAAVRRTVPDGGSPLRIADVASGGGEVALAAAAWLGREGRPVEIVGIDLHPRTLRIAREEMAGHPAAPRLCRGDALHLPLPDRSVDLALCTTALHHFTPEEAVRVLSELARISRGAVVVGDLRRSRYGWLGAVLLAVTAWRRSAYTRHDGPLSVRRAYTPAEVATLAERAGLEGAEVRPAPISRLVLEWRQPQ